MNKCFFCYKPTSEGNYHPLCSRKFFGTKIIPTLSLDQKNLEELAQQNLNRRFAIAGVQPKLSLHLEKQDPKLPYKLTVVGLWGNYILKPQSSLYSYMPETEDLTMHLASLFKIPICQHTLFQSLEGERVYMAKRFDRKEAKKIHVEDFCQLSGFLTYQKYKSSYERVGSLILKYCTYRGLDALSFFELLLFCFLSGNNDMHLKNFSLIYHKDMIQLAPAYDLLNVNLIYPSDKEELALTLNGKKKRINSLDFDHLAFRLEISKKTRDHIYYKYKNAKEKVVDLIESSFLPLDYQKKYLEIWNERTKTLW